VLEPVPDQTPALLADDIVELAPPATGCPFQRRCPKKLGDVCVTTAPPWQMSPSGHGICCHISRDQLTPDGRASAHD
jgi:peptide/nickel transport system ATP-binding protein